MKLSLPQLILEIKYLLNTITTKTPIYVKYKMKVNKLKKYESKLTYSGCAQDRSMSSFETA